MGIYILRALFSLLFLGAGLYFLRAAGRTLLRVRQWKSEGVVVDGTVIGFQEDAARVSPSYTAGPRPVAPVVEYRLTPDAEARTFVSSFATQQNPYTVGQHLPVRYLPSDVSVVELDSETQGYLVVLLLLVPAFVCLGIATLPVVMNL